MAKPSDFDKQELTGSAHGLPPRQQLHHRSAQRSKLLSGFVQITLLLIVSFSAFIGIINYVAEPVMVEGQSMEPTLQNANRLFINRIGQIQRFDIVVFTAPNDPSSKYIKRVIGLPGETIDFKKDKLYVNNILIDEPFIADQIKIYNKNKMFYTNDFSLKSVTGKTTVPKGTYFVMGDNRPNSMDSRSFGFIKKSAIDGIALFRFYPIQSFGSIPTVQHDN